MMVSGFNSRCEPEYRLPPIDVCGSCGQTLLTTPDDPPTALLCDSCLSGMRAPAMRPEPVRPALTAEYQYDLSSVHDIDSGP